MLRIKITEETRTVDDMVVLLQNILKQVEEGNTSGYYPTWSLDGEAEPMTRDELSEEVRDYLMATHLPAEVQAYFDGDEDHPAERGAAADKVYESMPVLAEFDEEHGDPDSSGDMEVRVPALALVHEVLAERREELHEE